MEAQQERYSIQDGIATRDYQGITGSRNDTVGLFRKTEGFPSVYLLIARTEFWKILMKNFF